MADLTPLDEKLAEVLGLAQAAQKATDQVASMEGGEDFAGTLRTMGEQAAETERRTDALIDGLDGKKTAIREMARETKTEAIEMMKTYLEGEEEALDGFEFLAMAEAGELGHWEIVQQMAATSGAADVRGLAAWAVRIQREHVERVRRASLELAAEEAREMAASWSAAPPSAGSVANTALGAVIATRGAGPGPLSPRRAAAPGGPTPSAPRARARCCRAWPAPPRRRSARTRGRRTARTSADGTRARG